MMGVPAVAVFGPSDPVLWSPIGPAVKIVRSPTECSPCTPDEMHACQERICLDAVEVSEILKACAEIT